MYLHALATAVPSSSCTQPECWELARGSPVRARLSRRSLFILQSILTGDSGIARRHFCVGDLANISDYTAA
jgi:alkylresorcinol/alkylpyrone synthase